MKYAELSDEELERVIEDQYGKEWKLTDLDAESELFAEYMKRITSGM